MDSRLVWFLIVSLVLTALAVLASYTSLTAQWETSKRWLFRPLTVVTSYRKIGVAILVLGIPIWHFMLVGFLTKGRLHFDGKMDNGGVIATFLNPLTNRITAQLEIPRRSLSLTDLTDLYVKQDLENLLLIMKANPSFWGDDLKQKYDPYAMLLPYQNAFTFTPLPYTLPSGKEIKVWGVSPRRPSQRDDLPYILEYQSELNVDDLNAVKKEVNEIWETFRNSAEHTDYKRAGITVKGSAPMKSGQGSGEVWYTFIYTKGNDGVWRAASEGSADSCSPCAHFVLNSTSFQLTQAYSSQIRFFRNSWLDLA